MVHLVTYDLHQHGRDYPKIEAALLKARSAVHPMGSVWLIDSKFGAGHWRDLLKGATDSNDEIFVARLQGNWGSFGFDKDAVAWLKDSAREW